MTEKADFCGPCPLRGLCSGEVELGIRRIKYTVDDGGYPGIEVGCIDEEGIYNTIARVTPQTYTIEQKKRKGLQSVTYNTNPTNADRSDEIFSMLATNPGPLLDQIAARSKRCHEPEVSRRQTDDLTYEYYSLCRAASIPVLEALVINTNSMAEEVVTSEG